MVERAVSQAGLLKPLRSIKNKREAPCGTSLTNQVIAYPLAFQADRQRLPWHEEQIIIGSINSNGEARICLVIHGVFHSITLLSGAIYPYPKAVSIP
jgi:hypothetical protein